MTHSSANPQATSQATAQAQADAAGDAPTALRTSSVTACGIRSRVLQGGPNPKATEAVVFVHGNPGSAQDWSDLMTALAPHARVIAIDMPGFGKADKPDSYPYSVEGGATFLTEALKELGVLRAHLVLHDFGGPWGLMWAALNPLGLASITLMNTGLVRDYRWHFMARVWQTPWLGELQMRTTNRSGFRMVMKIGAPRGLPLAFVDRMYDDLDRGTQNAVLKLYRATRDLNERSQILSNMLKPLNPPVLVVWGAADPYLPARLAEFQKETFPRAQVVMLPESGHFPFADDPAGVAQAVVPFIQAQLASNRQA
jgi:pimeloyl-ACP methyl ester carboxylesterase